MPLTNAYDWFNSYFSEMEDDAQASDTVEISSVLNYSQFKNINQFTTEDWVQVPGIGNTLAKRLIESGPYNNLEDIQSVKGISQKLFNNIVTWTETKTSSFAS